MAEGIVEQRRRLDASRKLLSQKLAALSSGDRESIPKEEFGKLIKRYQKEIQNQMDRFGDTCSLLTESREFLSRVPDFAELFGKCVTCLDTDPDQREFIENLKRELGDLSIYDSSVESLEKQINGVRLERDQRIQKIRIAAAARLEAQKGERLKAISESIRRIEESKQKISSLLLNAQSEISECEDSIRKFEDAEQTALISFIQESAQLETSLIQARSKLDSLRSRDIESQVSKQRSTLAGLQCDIQKSQSIKESLESELHRLKSVSNRQIETEIESKEGHLRDLQVDLETSPSLEDWSNVQTELKVRRVVDQSSFIELSKRVSSLRIQAKTITSEISRIKIELDEFTKILANFAKEKEQLERVKRPDCEANVIEMLEEQIQSLKSSIVSKEKLCRDLRNEKIAVEGRTQFLKGERDELVCNEDDFLGERKSRMRAMSGIERIFVLVMNRVFSRRSWGIVFIGYLIVLHVLAFLVFFL
jgi:predicted  nucleic acid-binding Zn-ribbon protein